ncbi:hypothetical protein ABG067_003043 [Albugo candida]|uniref:Uncharacterized protein n=1 Tax=Albugo candida TaxID=65357 RepID=A0A024G3Z9_9STRA|nr:unnamed protein product [Albugo candida]|eukprot:CCI41039.1 unnamed protein product [Albugo candida]
MDNFRVIVNRAGNTLFVVGSSAAVIGKEKGLQAFHAASGAAAIGREKVKSTNAFQTACNAAAVGKEKASATATVGKTKASSAYTLLKSRLQRRSSDPTCESNPAVVSGSKEFYKYEMTEEERRKKRAESKRRAAKNGTSSSSSRRKERRSQTSERSKSTLNGEFSDKEHIRKLRSKSTVSSHPEHTKERRKTNRDGSDRTNSRSKTTREMNL